MRSHCEGCATVTWNRRSPAEGVAVRTWRGTWFWTRSSGFPWSPLVARPAISTLPAQVLFYLADYRANGLQSASHTRNTSQRWVISRAEGMRRRQENQTKRGNLGSVESIELPRSGHIRRGRENTESTGEVVSIKILNLTTQYQLALLPSSLEASLYSACQAGNGKVFCKGTFQRKPEWDADWNQEENLEALSVGTFRKQLQSSLDASRRISWVVCALPMTEACPTCLQPACSNQQWFEDAHEIHSRVNPA